VQRQICQLARDAWVIYFQKQQKKAYLACNLLKNIVVPSALKKGSMVL